MAANAQKWNFVNANHPEDLKDAGVKRSIRSHIAHGQHEKAAKARRGPLAQGRLTSSQKILPASSRRELSALIDGNGTHHDGSRGDRGKDIFQLRPLRHNVSSRGHSNPHGRRSQWTIYTPMFDNARFLRGTTNQDPFHCFAVDYKPWFTQLLDPYYERLLPIAQQTLQASEKEAKQWEIDGRRQALTDQALFYVALLSATA